MTDPLLTRSVWLPRDPDGAFALFTQRISDWWPADRRHTGEATSRIVIDPGGAFEEIASDGRVVPLGRVRTWRAGARLVLDFYPGTDPEHPTAVEVHFLPEAGGTRVLIEHRHTPSSRELWETRAPRYAASWERVLAALAAFAP